VSRVRFPSPAPRLPVRAAPERGAVRAQHARSNWSCCRADPLCASARKPKRAWIPAPGASSSALLSGARPTQEDLREAALLENDELSRAFDREKLWALVLAAGQPPLIVRRLLY